MSKKPAAGTATGTVLIKNSQTLITRWQFAARGNNTGWHEA